MTKVYEPTLAEGAEWALPVKQSDNTTILERFGLPIGGDWTPIPMRLLTHDEHGHRLMEVDMPWLGNHLLILRRRDRAAQKLTQTPLGN
jgi:hypothetical protein